VRGDGAEKIRRQLRRWFRTHGRDLPWRQTTDPYAILVSEFMLQQTTVAAVVPYFKRWMATFPNVAALAAAEESQVLSHWQGLGYYSRARNLHRAARKVMGDHGGQVPHDRIGLRSLPGVGDYTAGAVMAFAYDAAVPVIDANIARVLARLEDWKHPIDDPRGSEFLQAAAERLLPARGGRRHTSAVMELGALVCVAKTPRCGQCPVRANCRAGEPARLPIKRPRRAVEEVQDQRAFVWAQGKIWLECSSGPRWRGLWMLPVAENPRRAAVYEEIYPITRFRVALKVVREGKLGRELTGFPPGECPAMPSPHRRAVAALTGKRHS